MESRLLFYKVRRAVGDFGVPISIVVFGVLACITSHTFSEKLSVPDGLSPSDSTRGWIVSPFDEGKFPVWAMFAAIIPAILVYILVFMETHISE